MTISSDNGGIADGNPSFQHLPLPDQQIKKNDVFLTFRWVHYDKTIQRFNFKFSLNSLNLSQPCVNRKIRK